MTVCLQEIAWLDTSVIFSHTAPTNQFVLLDFTAQKGRRHLFPVTAGPLHLLVGTWHPKTVSHVLLGISAMVSPIIVAQSIRVITLINKLVTFK